MTIFHNFLEQLSVYSVLLPLGLGLIIFKHLEVNSRIVILLLLFASISQLTSYLTSNRNIIWSFYNMYTVADSILWAIIFYRSSSYPLFKAGILLIIFCLTAWSVILFYYIGPGTRFFPQMVCLNSLIQLVCVLFYFYQRYRSEQILALEKEPIFWFCLGLLIYAPCTYFLFAFFNVIQAEKKFSYLWTIHYLLNSLMYFIFSVGMYVNIKRQKVIS